MRESLFGAGIAIIIFLAINGINVTPIVLFAALIGCMVYFMQGQGQIKIGSGGASLDRPSLLEFDQIGGQDSAIKELKEALQFVLNPEEIDHMGM